MPITVLSPAKTFNEKNEKGQQTKLVSTEPAPGLAADRAELLAQLKQLSAAEIQKLMGVSAALAQLNRGRFLDFDAQPQVSAGVGFDGPAHKAFAFSTLSPAAQAYAQEHVATLSGLYGILRPCDAIRPYRLEMSTKLRTERGGSLYEFWGARISAELLIRLRALPLEEQFIVNVASNEYWAAVGKHLNLAGAKDKAAAAKVEVYTIEFPGPSVYAKVARGAFARFMAETQVRTPKELSGFEGWSQAQDADYAFKLAPSSAGNKLTFARVVTLAKGAAKGAAKAKVGSRDAAQGEGEDAEAPLHKSRKRA
ncbi:hypothetical protein T492DRAFT_1040498 [Pavlovales sp. CCMP2436]|nr:hypothetical protein T492DRAFT_1040498 [Pavlovales sp. CCMP2436]